MEIQGLDRKIQYRSALYTERAGLTVRVIPILMGLAAIFAVFFTGVYMLLGRPMQWLVMLGTMVLTFSLFTSAYAFARRGHADVAVYTVVIGLNLLGTGGAISLDGWFAMSVLLAYVGLACARLFSGRVQNWVVVVMTTLSVITQIILTYFGPVPKYANPILVQVLLWIGYAISGIFVVGYISDTQDQRQEELLEQAGSATDQLQLQTTTLEKQTVTLQRRTDFLIQMMQVMQDLGNPEHFADIVTEIVKSIHKEYGFYHVAYYEVSGLLAPAVLVDAAGVEASDWKKKDFHVSLDAQDPIAEVARLGRSVLSNQNDLSSSHTVSAKSRVTVPISANQSGVVGVLDIQDRDEGIFQQGELLLMEMLANQISLAIQSTLRYEDVSHRLEGAMRSSREANLASWREWMQVNPKLSFQYNGQRSIESAEHSDTQQVEKLPVKRTEYAIPLSTVQGQTLGKVTAHKPNNWTVEEIALLTSLIEQVEQTLENARLYQTTERRAVREQMTRSITDSIRSAVTVEDAIRRAVTELAQAVHASEVEAQLNVVRGESDA